jgi:cytochrome b subunit of formate dehydrogenase
MTESRLIYRHRFWVRVARWIVICMTIMLMSGLQIFNAHPALYWGNTSHFDNPLRVIRAIPAWTRLPGIEWLAMGRRGHFCAWLFATMSRSKGSCPRGLYRHG